MDVRQPSRDTGSRVAPDAYEHHAARRHVSGTEHRSIEEPFSVTVDIFVDEEIHRAIDPLREPRCRDRASEEPKRSSCGPGAEVLRRSSRRYQPVEPIGRGISSDG